MKDTNVAGRTRGYKKRARTHQRLLEAGVETYGALGAGLTVKAVIEHAGVSNGTFYNYFDDLDQFVEAVVMHVVGGVAEGVAMSGAEDPARRFAAASLGSLLAIYEHPDWAAVILRYAARPDAGAEMAVFLAADLAEGYETGRFTMPGCERMVDVVLGALFMAIRRIAAGSASERDLSETVAHLLEIIGVDRTEALALVAEAVPDPVGSKLTEENCDES